MTRAMLVTVLWRADGRVGEGNNSFQDVHYNSWFTVPILWANTNNIVNGKGGGKFDPDGNITREQIAVILYRYANYKGYDTTNRKELNTFADHTKVSAWALDAMQWAVAEGLINGSGGKLIPLNHATRAQVATIMMRFMEKFS
jgi:hypothetical protein